MLTSFPGFDIYISHLRISFPVYSPGRMQEPLFLAQRFGAKKWIT